MANPRAPLAALLAALLALPLPALAAAPAYPRPVVRKGKLCQERLDNDGTVLIDCTNAPPAPAAPPDDAGATGATGATASADARTEAEAIAAATPTAADGAESANEGSRDPVEQGRQDGAADARGNTYFFSGLVGGCLLGPVGCLGATFVGGTSEPTPPLAGRWESESDERAYRLAYENELQGERGSQALWGGVTGIAIVLGVIGFVYLVRDQ
jgi:hypothetical protein